MAGLGWAGIIVPEEFGGLAGFAGLGAVIEETGRTLTASPLFATAARRFHLLLAGSAKEPAARRSGELPRAGAGGIASPDPCGV
jgi:acyl-CoA dehydrogenase